MFQNIDYSLIKFNKKIKRFFCFISKWVSKFTKRLNLFCSEPVLDDENHFSIQIYNSIKIKVLVVIHKVIHRSHSEEDMRNKINVRMNSINFCQSLFYKKEIESNPQTNE